LRHRHRIALLCAAILAVAVPLPPPARAGEAIEQLKSDVALVLGTREAGRDGLQAATLEMFDWNEMAHRVLGDHQWSARTEAEREQFVRLLGGLVQGQIAALGAVRSESVEYLGESVDNDTATVETRIPRGPGNEMRLDYALLRRDGRWRVYDVVVNHASLLGNYRAQFRKILKTVSYEGLIAKLTAR